MTLLVGIRRAALVLLAGLLLAGCMPPAPADDEKEEFYQAGKDRVKNRDYAGAVESFEKALERNPRSGPAHFELGWLYEEKVNDPAAAIYHYDRFLKLSPNSGKQEMVATRIMACKQQLAQSVSLGPVTEKQQRELEQLLEENKRLREEVEKWRAYAGRGQGGTNPPPMGAGVVRGSQTGTSALTEGGVGGSAGAAGPNRGGTPTAAAQRTYVVKAGDTPIGIARKYGVKLEALLSANPRLDPKRMHVGQTVVIPSP